MLWTMWIQVFPSLLSISPTGPVYDRVEPDILRMVRLQGFRRSVESGDYSIVLPLVGEIPRLPLERPTAS